MTQFDSTLLIKRLLIHCSGTVVYDETFHNGVNIIRGTNSSGKSTIIDFMFFVLGGDLSTWKPEAEKCDNIVAEIEINNTPIVIKREITLYHRQPMYVFWGTYEEASISAEKGWVKYPFNRSQSKDSFSQLLFNAFNYPEIKSDNDESITMHQILRLLYIDQKTPFDTLMRIENFDSALIRSAVGDLLIGVYDDNLYKLEHSLRDRKKENELITEQIKNIHSVFANSDENINPNEINTEIENDQIRLKKIEDEINNVKAKAEVDLKLNPIVDDIQSELQVNKNELYKLKNELNRINFEIEDSINFIEALISRENSLEESIKAREIIGGLSLSFCPACLSPLDKNIEDDKCILCKNELVDNYNSSQALRMKQELRLQIKESELLLGKRNDKRNQILNQLPIFQEKVNSFQKDYNSLVHNSRSSRDELLDSLFVKKGSLENNIIHLRRKLQLANSFEELKNRKSFLISEISTLETNLKELSNKISRQKHLATKKIEEYAIYFLKNDLPREEEFQNANSISIDFYKNTFSVNGRNQFSASSTVYLKNSIRFALFFASLELDYFRYPRFILCDNTEDKGMEDIRSHRFQELLVQLSNKLPTQHQLIYTTSKINPAFNNTSYCIGIEYDTTHKTLNFKGSAYNKQINTDADM